MKFEEIGARNRKREDGAWVTEGFRDLDGIKLKVRGNGSSAHVARLRELVDAASPEERKSPTFNETVDKQVMLDVLLVGWDLEDKEFSREAAKELLELAVFREAVDFASRVVAARGVETLEADAKN